MAFGVCLLFVLPVFAADNQSPVRMEEVVVTATRDKEEVRKVPANITVITAEDIQASGATTIPEILEKVEGITFRSYSGSASQAVLDLRGFGGDNPFGKTLIMLDGRRLNRPDQASLNWLQIPINSIEKIEIVRGAGSVLYGDNAIGGVINVITKKGGGQLKGNASVTVGSYGLHDEQVGITGSSGKLSYAVTGENNFNSGYRERSKYTARGGGVDLGYTAGDLLNVSLGVSVNETNYQMPGSLTKEQMEQDRRQYQPAMPEFFMNANDDNDASDKYTNVNLGMQSFWGSWGQLDLNLLYGKKDLEMNMPSWFSYNYSDTSIDTYGVTPKYILDKAVFGFHNKLIVGVDYYREPYKKDIFGNRDRTVKLSTGDFTRESLGFYIRDEFNLLKNLIFNVGYRSERTTIEGSNEDFSTPANSFRDMKNTYNAEAYEAGLTWLWGKKSKLYAKYSTVYRIPFLDEVASFSGFGGAFLTDLEKEKGIGMETGTEFYLLDHLKMGLTLFRIDMEDEIQWVYTSVWTGENQNVGKTRHDGVEVSISYLWKNRAKVYGNFTYHMARFENGIDNKKEMPLVPNRIANGGVEIYLPYNLMLRPEVRYVGNAVLSGDNDNSTEKLEAYTLLNLYLSYKPTFGKLNVTAFIAGENLGDEKYSTFGIDYVQYGMPNFYYPVPGRTFKAGVSFAY